MADNKERFMAIQPNGIEYTSDGKEKVLLTSYRSPDVSIGEMKQAAAEHFGISPESIKSESDEPRSTRNMASAAFSAARWNSKWIPQGDKDRAEKQPYDPMMN